ncbi:type VII secretion protein EccB [Rhodococcus kyotonensis]|uniref:Type VII secretion protein EccB n=1 Tax=Rhodococcoides kyotonense TaxID=398843 RepID=A0A177Y6A2_9NOCA|nr:type VII secretion protein EccB [Rhodococcus kyotonensis]NIL77273.1 ESX-2 secretion system ATPase EccB2 [Rhodococcus sp. B10]OAK51005.1 type VII secretion protein EccB [Rhodococcus kyotonensis]
MAATPTTKWQVGGYRFLVRRMEHALVRRDVRMLHDPMRSQSRALSVGLVIACIGLAGCAALALLRPQDKIGDASVVVAKDSGAMFVRVDDVFHPVLNLASARLVVGRPETPTIVKESELAGRPRGSLVGIPGAPSALPQDDAAAGAWTVCDTLGATGSVSETTVVIGDPVYGNDIEPLRDDEALLWSTLDGTYLVYGGGRARIDLGDRAVVRALGLDDAVASPVSPGMADAVPVVPAITPPFIPRAGELPNYPMVGKTIGSVVKVTGVNVAYYVVLEKGIQAISEATAQLIVFADSQGNQQIDAVLPDVLFDAPTVTDLAVQTFPAAAPTLVDTSSAPVGCVTWSPLTAADGGPTARIVASSGSALPLDARAAPVRLAQADSGGPAADAVFLTPGSGRFVRTTGIGANSTRQDSSFFVADTGVRFGVPDAESAKALGLDEPVSAPWQMVELLGPGPALSRAAALTAHDGVDPPPNAAALPSN